MRRHLQRGEVQRLKKQCEKGIGRMNAFAAADKVRWQWSVLQLFAGMAGVSLAAARDPSGAELELAELKMMRAREHMGRSLKTDDLQQMLGQNMEHPLWDDVAERCLSCGNCTMVCPTCFCSTITDATDLTGGRIERNREWESCFTHQFSYTVAGPGRDTIRSRYRHWLRHKLCTWWDQFGTSGCVGCGRCITWCPVGIDLTEFVEQIRETSKPLPDASSNPQPYPWESEEVAP